MIHFDLVDGAEITLTLEADNYDEIILCANKNAITPIKRVPFTLSTASPIYYHISIDLLHPFPRQRPFEVPGFVFRMPRSSDQSVYLMCIW